MNLGKMFAAVIVSVSVLYGIYQVASESGENAQANSTALTADEPASAIETASSELK